VHHKVLEARLRRVHSELGATNSLFFGDFQLGAMSQHTARPEAVKKLVARVLATAGSKLGTVANLSGASQVRQKGRASCGEHEGFEDHRVGNCCEE
jgi:hypothetical protein